MLRLLMQGNARFDLLIMLLFLLLCFISFLGNQEVPKAPLGNNYRPTQSLNDRVIRTSINFKSHEKVSYCIQLLLKSKKKCVMM